MATCGTPVEAFLAQDSTLNVSEKYKQLMQDSLGEGSLYERTKDSFYELFDKLNVSESEQLTLVASNITSLANTLSAQAMTTAIAWAKEERDAAFQLAHTKAQTELILAQKELTTEQVCKAQTETQLAAAQLAETLAATIRQDALNAAQVEQVEAQRYAQLAEAFRKSGKVNVGTDTDGVIKGLSGDVSGHTNKQVELLDRQIVSFEDSKRNHCANSAASLFGQMLSAEVPIDKATDPAYQAWLSSIQYLAQNS